MREIKFRAWDKIHGKMSNDFTLLAAINQEQAFALPENFDFMQYTGLKDKNGTEIYEGDIVTAENVSRPLIVYYDVRRAAYRMGYRGEGTQYDKSEPIFDDDYCEVIGNIYENSRLVV